ncbi:3018_t:CDS:2, partial [Acaulospora colombiana]
IGFPSRYSASHSQARPNWSAQMDAGTPFTNLGQFSPGHFEQPTHAYKTTRQAGLELEMDSIFGGTSGASTTGVSSHLSPHTFSQPIAPPSMQRCDPIPIQFNQARPLPTLPAHESAFLSDSSLHVMMASYRQQRDASSHGETSPGMFNQEQGQGLAGEVFQPAHMTSPSYTGEDDAPTPALSIEEPNSELYISSNNTPLANNVALADDSIESFCISSFPADQELQQTLREVMSVGWEELVAQSSSEEILESPTSLRTIFVFILLDAVQEQSYSYGSVAVITADIERAASATALSLLFDPVDRGRLAGANPIAPGSALNLCPVECYGKSGEDEWKDQPYSIISHSDAPASNPSVFNAKKHALGRWKQPFL